MQRLSMALRAMFMRRSVEAEMDKEIRLHLESEVEENIRRGMSAADARRAALVAFGGIERAKDDTRDERPTQVFESAAADVRFALRGLRRQPAFALAVIVLMALGTGANTAIFSVVDEMILRPLPFADGDRMVELMATAAGGQFEIPPSLRLTDLVRTRSTTLEEVARYAYSTSTLGDTTRFPVRELATSEVTPGLMAFTGLRPYRGRDILPSDTLAGAPLVAVIGYRVWHRDLGGSDSVIGATVLLDGRPHTVVGVAPRGFFIPFVGARDVFVAMQSDPRRGGSSAIAKLRRGRTLADANRELAALGKLVPPISAGIPEDAPTVKDASTLTRAAPRRIILVLFGAVGFVLLIACGNVANLMLSRAMARQREFAVRGAMGAGRRRLARQLFTESLLLSAVGGLLGFAIAIGLLKLVVAAQPENIGIEGRVDAPVFAWTLMLSIATGLLFGIAPVLLVGDGRIGDLLKASARATTGSVTSARFRAGLVVFELALSVVLLIGAGMMVRTLSAMQRASLGMDPHAVSAVQVRFARGVDSLARRDALISVRRRVAATPGIDAATWTLTMPPEFGASLQPFEIEGLPPTDSIGATAFNYGQENFFAVAGIRFVAGRPFRMDRRFTDRVSASEVVINERFAHRFWPSGAVGARMRRNGTWVTVVGVVQNIDVPGVENLKGGLQEYFPMPLAPGRVTLVVKSQLPAVQLETLLRQAIRESGARVTVSGFSSAEADIARGRAMHRFTLLLIGGFAILAAVIAAIGLHAVISYSVQQRLREIGIRIALGAQKSQVVQLVFRQGMRLAFAGVVVGCVAGAVATRALRSLLYGVEPGDPLTLLLVGALLLVVAVVASSLPARRAARVDLVEMIRAE